MNNTTYIFCLSHNPDTRGTIDGICTICLQQRIFHIDCMETSKRAVNGNIICTNCYWFIQADLIGLRDNLFMKIRVK